MTVLPGTQLPQVEVDSLVRWLTASLYGGANVLVVVGDGIDDAYLRMGKYMFPRFFGWFRAATYRIVSLRVYENGWKK